MNPQPPSNGVSTWHRPHIVLRRHAGTRQPKPRTRHVWRQISVALFVLLLTGGVLFAGWQGLSAVTERLDTVNLQLGLTNQKLTTVNQEVDSMSTRLQEQLGQTNEKLTSVNQELDSMSARLQQ